MAAIPTRQSHQVAASGRSYNKGNLGIPGG